MSDESTLSGALNAKQTTNADADAARTSGLMHGDEVRFNARIPQPLRDAFSDLCDRKGATMTGAVQRYMMRAVKEDKL
jgi:hypothetical protein